MTTKRHSLFIYIGLLFVSCSMLEPNIRYGKVASDKSTVSKIKDLEKILNRSEEQASPQAKSILATGRSMINDGEILVGSCWDYINAVYNRADFPLNKRKTIMKSKKKGPFAKIDRIEPGDWLYYINHSYSRVEHSGVFIGWINRDKKKAVVMSYQGGKNKTPATYKIYDLKNVYHIIRPE